MDPFSWDSLFRRRQEVHARHPSVFRLPKVQRAVHLVGPHLHAEVRILEVGAGERKRGARLIREIPGACCESVDPDPEGRHDYHHIEEVAETYDVILALELLEHLPLEDGLELLCQARARLTPGGVFVTSTPNIYCPGRFLRDATHVTPYAWDELGGALLLAGFDFPSLYRVVPGSWLKRLGKGLTAILGRPLGLDHAPSVAAVAKAGR